MKHLKGNDLRVEPGGDGNTRPGRMQTNFRDKKLQTNDRYNVGIEEEACRGQGSIWAFVPYQID